MRVEHNYRNNYTIHNQTSNHSRAVRNDADGPHHFTERREVVRVREIWEVIQLIITVLGGCLGYFLGGCDGLLVALLVFVCLDYITGVLNAAVNGTLSSEVGFKGICRKVLVFVMVGVANLLDVHVFGETGILRTATVFFYMSNEGISITENAARLGLPIPHRLKAVLEQLHERSETEDISTSEPSGNPGGSSHNNSNRNSKVETQ